MAELVHGYRRPAAVLGEKGAIVCLNAAATQLLDRQPGDDEDGDLPLDPSAWPRRAAFRADGVILYLAVPDHVLDLASPDLKHVPPRLAKIARLVISGCTDKQIAVQTGLSFSTVRTYVRQIYRRLGVHSRVELVNASLDRK